METKPKKITEKKNVFKNIISELKNIRVEEIMFVILLITGLLVLIGFFQSKLIWSSYYVKPTSAIYYFDLFIRNGVFKYAYFAFVIALVYLAGKLIMREKFNLNKKLIVLALGLVIAFAIYLLPPYYIEKIEPIPGSFELYPEAKDIYNLSHASCGDRIDLLFSPSSEHFVKEMPEINLLIKEGIQINMFCIGDRSINDDIRCRKDYNLDPRAGERLRKELGLGKIEYNYPQLVVGCKYWIKALQNASTVKAFICDKTNLTNLC